MRILFINTRYSIPQSYGGLAVTLHQLARGMASRGHYVAVLSGFRKGSAFAAGAQLKMKARQLLGEGKMARDRGLGYPVWRTWDVPAALAETIAIERPDILVIMGGQVVPVVDAARASGVPILIQVHDVELPFHGGDFSTVADLPCVANSEFTANFYERMFRNDPVVIYPLIERDRYAASSSREAVIVVNPTIKKGGPITLATAKICQEIPFLFVGALPRDLVSFTNEAGDILANVECLPSQPDMKTVYARGRILLAPSQWEEAFGRVALEAAISGIPTVGSSRGGLPEAIHRGGIILPADSPPEAWAQAVREIWHDPKRHAELSALALASSLRPEMDSEVQLDRHERAMEACLRGGSLEMSSRTARSAE